jgi:serine/threonine protein kinase
MTAGLNQFLLVARAELGDEVTAEDIADAVWLARWRTVAPPADPGPGLVEPPALEGPPAPPDARAQPESAPEPSLPHPPAGAGDGPVDPAAAVDAALPAASGPGERAGRVFGARAAPALPDPLALTRALRPLTRHAPSRTRFVLDADATIHRLADERVLIPVLRPAAERWLRLVLVADGGVGGELWRDAAREFRAVLANVGAFKDVRAWVLDADGPEPRVAPLAARGGPATRHPDELLDPLGGTLTVVMSPFVAAGWRDGSAARVLNRWAARGTVVLIPLLPERLWARTALGAATPVQVSAPGPGVPNARLRWTRPRAARRSVRLAGDDELPKSPESPPIAFPLAALEPDALKRWAAVLAGRPGATAPGVLYAPASAPRADAPPAELTAEQRLKQFRLTSSPLAQRLVGLLAASPVSVKVLGVIRTKLLPGAGLAHEAEVLFGGLLRRTSPPGESDPQFEFRPGVRELLLGAVRPDDGLNVLEEVSEYLGERFADGRSFRTVLADPSGETGLLTADKSPFARIAADVLLRAGGAYAKLVRRAPKPSPEPLTPRPDAAGAGRSEEPVAGSAVGTEEESDVAPTPAREELLRTLPLPLARCYRRAANANDPRDQFLSAFRMWEATVKLLAVVALTEYARSGRRTTAASQRLRSLDRPALGHWIEFLRLFGELPVRSGPLAGAAELLFGRPRGDLPHAARLHEMLRRLNRGDDPTRVLALATSTRAIRVSELFDGMVQFRNKEIAHGFGLRPEAFYQAFGLALLAALVELLPRLEVLTATRLVYIDNLQRSGGGYNIGGFDLSGEVARRVASTRTESSAEAHLPTAGRAYLEHVREAQWPRDPRPLTPSALRSLHPLVLFQPDSEDVYFLDAIGPQPKYRSYTRDTELVRADLADDLRRFRVELVAHEVGAEPTSAADETAVPDAAVETFPRPFGEYELLGSIGQSGLNVVYRARRGGGPEVAIKTLRRQFVGDENARERFRREYRILGRLRHPGLVRVMEFGEHDGRSYFVMTLVEGARLESPVRLPAEAARLAAAIADALQHVHDAGVVHRNLKPSNVLLASDGRPVVAGFNHAVDLSDGGIGTGGEVGAPAYMPPEQWRGDLRQMGPRSDVYALGGVLYKLLTGRTPFGGSSVELMGQVLSAERPVPPSELVLGLDAELSAITLRALEKDPADRWPSMAEFGAALTAVAARLTRPPAASADPLAELTRRLDATTDEAETIELLRRAAELADPQLAAAVVPRLGGQRPEAVRQAALKAFRAIGVSQTFAVVEELARRGDTALDAVLDGLAAIHAREDLVELLNRVVGHASGEVRDKAAAIRDRKRLSLDLTVLTQKFKDARSPLDLQRMLGRGRFTDSYLARDNFMHADMVVRVLRDEFARVPAAREQFLNAHRQSAQLAHPNLVRTHQVGSLPGGPAYAVRGSVEGATLRSRLDRSVAGPPIPPERVVEMLRQLLHALDELAEAGLYHGDVQPSNIFVTSGDQIVLGDRAMPAIPVVDSTGEWVDAYRIPTPGRGGEPVFVRLEGRERADAYRYSAPEVFRDAAPGPAADLYSFACVAHELFCGEIPYTVEATRVYLPEYSSGFVPPPPAPHPRIRPSVERFLRPLLEPAPDGRGTAADALRALDALYFPGTESSNNH